jgi:hypothetical protein
VGPVIGTRVRAGAGIMTRLAPVARIMTVTWAVIVT